MTTLISETDLNCYPMTEDCAVISIRDQKYVVDYSTLMDFLTELATVASLIENLNYLNNKETKEFQNDYH
jgi:hypothetical protein